MTTLKVDFSEGDILTAGTITSTSGINGITTQINSNTVLKLKYADSDLTEGSVASSTAETTIGSVTVLADTVSTGCLIVASLRVEAGSDVNQGTFRLKTGVASSEAERTQVLLKPVAGAGAKVGGVIAWYDTVANYAADVSIIITGQNSESAASNKSICHSIIAFGI